MIFKPTFLYIKRHRSTGLLYFGKTTRTNPEKYKGSGVYWGRHMSSHGSDIETLWFCLYTDRESIEEFALLFSRMHHITESTSWANLKDENGLDGGGSPGRKWSNDHRAKMELIHAARRKPKEVKECYNRSEQYTGENNPFFGKKHKEISKRYGESNPAKRPEVREKMRGSRPDYMPHNHYVGWEQETKDKISNSLKGKKRSKESIEKQKKNSKKRIWMTNGSETAFVLLEQTQELLIKGWRRGRG